MNYLSAEQIGKRYGERALFEDLFFGLERGKKAALVADNGAGKSTLLRILTQHETPDTGAVAYQKDLTVGYLPQEPVFAPNDTPLSYIFRAETPLMQALKAYEKSLADYEADPSDAHTDAVQHATGVMEDLKAWDFELKVKQILSLFRIQRLEQPAAELSGGQRKRIALARVLIEAPDLLILDEPTNHLDLDMIEWLEDYLSRQQLTLLLVTHDRYFLDRVCDEIWELEGGKLYKHAGNYAYFLEKKAEREAIEAQGVEKARNLMRKELDWVRRMPKARGTKAKYRLDAFEDLKEKATGAQRKDELNLQVKMSRLGGKILEAKHLKKSFGDLPILEDFNYTFKRKERVGIVGPNGVGKSTFLQLLTGKVAPDSGVLETGETVVFGYYTQEGLQLPEDKRVIDVVKEIAEVIPVANGSQLTASQFLNSFMFPPKRQYERVATLSGGERRRLYLLTILIKNPNFLILDEPTNDLDLATMTRLEEFLEEFGGCLLVVTHDRFFMDKIVDHLFIFEGEGVVKDFNGKYSEYRDVVQERERLAQEAAKAAKKAKETHTNAPTEQKKNKRSYKEQQEYEALEAEIEVLEQQKAALEAKLNGGTTDHAQLQQWAQEVGQLMEKIDEKTMRWLELSELA